jgi:hypothetical protein
MPPSEIVHQRVDVAVKLCGMLFPNPAHFRKNRVKWHRRPP